MDFLVNARSAAGKAPLHLVFFPGEAPDFTPVTVDNAFKTGIVDYILYVCDRVNVKGATGVGARAVFVWTM